MEEVMNLKSIQINLQLGQEILVGKKEEKARITKIEHFDKSGDIVINTTRGTRKVLTFKLCPDRSTIPWINIGKYLYESN